MAGLLGARRASRRRREVVRSFVRSVGRSFARASSGLCVDPGLGLRARCVPGEGQTSAGVSSRRSRFSPRGVVGARRGSKRRASRVSTASSLRSVSLVGHPDSSPGGRGQAVGGDGGRAVSDSGRPPVRPLRETGPVRPVPPEALRRRLPPGTRPGSTTPQGVPPFGRGPRARESRVARPRVRATERRPPRS